MSFVFDGITTIQCFECSDVNEVRGGWWDTIQLSLSPRLKTNPSVDHFQYCVCFPHIILEVMYVQDKVW